MTDAALRLRLHRLMVLARASDDRMAKLKAQGEVAGSAFLGRGQEAFSGAAGLHLKPGDVFAPCIRDQAGRFAFGETPLDAVRCVLGRRTGQMRGRDGNIHRGDWSRGLLPFISHLGAMLSPVLGVLMSRRLAGTLGDSVGAASIGDGGMSSGAVNEALTVAGVERLPFVLLVADNRYSYSTTSDRTYACAHLVDRAAAFGFAGHRCDGTDADACLKTMFEAVARARAGEGPQMVVATLLRLAGHGEHDDASYVDADLKSRFGDCVQLASRTLTAEGLISEAGVQRLWDEAKAQVAAALEQVDGEGEPDPEAEDWCAVRERQLTRFRS